MYYIDKLTSQKVLYLGVSKKTKGGMTAVLVSYDKYIEDMQFIPTWKLGNIITKAWYAFQAIARMCLVLVLNKNIRIIHIHGAAFASFDRCKLFIRLGKIFKKKIILHEHAADFKEFFSESTDKNAIIDTINRCAKLIVLSESWKEYFCSIGIRADKIVVLNNIVSPPVGEISHEPNNKTHLLYLGEVSKRKGCFDLLKAIADNRDYFKDKLIVRIGGNSVDGDIKAYISNHHLESFVKYEGWVAGDLKTECLRWEDIYILPSYNEGLPIAILEAMSYQHPVISTPVGGIPEVIKDGYNGKLVSPGNTGQIAEAIRYYIENKDTIQVHGANSLNIVKSFYPESVFSTLQNIYSEVLESTK